MTAALPTCLLASAVLLAAAPRKGAPRDRVLVPAGPTIHGSTKGDDDERPRHQIKVPAFKIDRTEVTRGMYARCVASKRCAKTDVDLQTDPQLPMTNVNWHEARAFCTYAGGRLPSEAEWEKAARGNDGREYPWGDDADCGKANWGNFEGEGPCSVKNPGHPVNVGQYPDGASPFGVLDLAGNVWEWVADRYELDPERRVVRGGSCCSYFVGPRSANRNAWDPKHRDVDLGFRCVER